MPRLNRRLGERRPVEPTEVLWNLPPSGWRQRFRKAEPQSGLLQDVSVTGAAVVAPADETILRGSEVKVAFGWVEGTVRVKRIDPHLDGARWIYGVEFESTDSPLAQAIHQVFLERDVPPF
jgi:hypothetical protein